MQIISTDIPDVKIIELERREDSRGFFCETFHAGRFAEAGIPVNFVQDNHSLSRDAGVVRGLHFQTGQAAQGKLVRVLQGAIFDVAVDLRRSSPTFGRHVSAQISAGNNRQMWIPAGFAHGFATLEPDTQVLYKTTTFYAPGSECGIRWNDPDLSVVWPVRSESAILSPKDQALPFWGQMQQECFE